MRMFLAGCACALFTACASTQTTVNVGVASSTTTSSTRVGINVVSDSTLATLVAIGALGAWLYRRFDAESHVPSFPASRDAVGGMAPGRMVAEQDCTRPIEFPEANLRCR